MTVVRRVQTWQLIVIAILLTVVSVALLRSNSLEAVRLFEQVKRADKEGKDTTKPLVELQRYVSQHMNTQLERVSLEESYARDYQKALDKLGNSGGVNDAEYRQAELACRAELYRTGSFPAYAQCVSGRVGQVSPGENPLLKANMPKPEQYQFTFISPAWSFDLAGLSIVVTGVIWFIIAAKLLVQVLLFWMVRRRHES